ncbi:MAG: phosphomannomutase/phosphoglucomutase [Proteobacteria bacterium]|nr:phosphomannomutase/phosphoglucomutase [Pseudomonadota bacterium]
MNPNIFREYDIRGLVDKDMDDEDVYRIGRGIGAYLAARGKRRVTLGGDCRLSTPRYADRVCQGLMDSGLDVIDLGMVPTPVFYFSVHHLDTDGGVQVTASHNPPEYNGFKVMCGKDTLHGDQIREIGRIVEAGEFVEGKGSRSKADVIAPYKEYFFKNIHVKKPLRIGVDAGNGSAGFVAVPILKATGCEVHDIFCDPDGRFPNHPPDPTVPKNMEDLIRLVREKGLDVGIGYDGDGDRIGVVDEKGTMIWGDQLMIIFSREILSRKPGSTFVSEVKCSKTMYDDIRAHGGNAIMWKTGHSLIKGKMKEVDAELAGEMSGHIFFQDRFFGFDDATYASCRLLEILADTGKTVSELLADVPKTFTTPEIRVECPDDLKFDVVAKVTQHFKDQGYEVIDIDGARVTFPDGWGLARASNTQPVLVLRFEALSEARRDEIRKLVEDAVAQVRKGLEG